MVEVLRFVDSTTLRRGTKEIPDLTSLNPCKSSSSYVIWARLSHDPI